jgi:hypothetical protein
MFEFSIKGVVCEQEKPQPIKFAYPMVEITDRCGPLRVMVQ